MRPERMGAERMRPERVMRVLLSRMVKRI